MIKEGIFLYKDFRYRLNRSKIESEKFKLSFFFKIWICDKLLNIEPTKSSLPWMPYNAIFELHSIIKKDSIVLETGTGGSTFFFLKRCKSLISIEHDKSWIKKVMSEYKKFKNKDSWDLVHRNLKCNQNSQTSPYLEYLESLNDHHFDLISIDGRLRSESLKIASKKVKRNGYILLDNSDREEYSDGINFLNKLGFIKKELSGLCYSLDWDSKSTIWQKV